MSGLFSWRTSDVIMYKSFLWGKSCSPEKRLPVSWLGRVKAWLASVLKAGGEEGWSLSIWFACVSLTLPFSLWHPCLCLYMVFPSPDTLLFHRTENKTIFCQDEEGSTLALQVQERGLVRTHNASVPPGSSLATSTGGWCASGQVAGAWVGLFVSGAAR